MTSVLNFAKPLWRWVILTVFVCILTQPAFSKEESGDPIKDLFETVGENVLQNLLETFPDIIPEMEDIEDILDWFVDDPVTVGTGVGILIGLVDLGLDETLEFLEFMGIDTTVDIPGFDVYNGELFGGDLTVEVSGDLDLLNDTIGIFIDATFTFQVGDTIIDVTLSAKYDWEIFTDNIEPRDDTLLSFGLEITFP